jgi:hypothetical protein
LREARRKESKSNGREDPLEADAEKRFEQIGSEIASV